MALQHISLRPVLSGSGGLVLILSFLLQAAAQCVVEEAFVGGLGMWLLVMRAQVTFRMPCLKARGVRPRHQNGILPSLHSLLTRPPQPHYTSRAQSTAAPLKLVLIPIELQWVLVESVEVLKLFVAEMMMFVLCFCSHLDR